MASIDLLEDALKRPAPGQVEMFLDHHWVVLTDRGLPRVLLSLFDSYAIHLFTDEAAFQRYDATHDGSIMRGRNPTIPWERTVIRGGDLFGQLARRDDYEDVIVDVQPFTHWPDPWRSLGPRFAKSVLAGADPRPGAGILRARSLAEIRLFLLLAGGPYQVGPTKFSDAPALQGDVAVDHRHTITWYFQPPEMLADPDDLGAGTTSILCAGALAGAIHSWLAWDPEGDAEDEDGRATLRDDVARWRRGVDELIKLLPQGGDAIPRDRVLTTKGLRQCRAKHMILTRAWLAEVSQRIGRLGAWVAALPPD